MLLGVVVLQIVMLLALLMLLLRKPAAEAVAPDPRHQQLPDQITLLHGKHDALGTGLRADLSDLRDTHARSSGDLRTELAGTLHQLREDNARAAAGLRTEVLGSVDTLGNTLKAELLLFRQDNTASADKLQRDNKDQHERSAAAFALLRGEISATLAPIEQQLSAALDRSSKAHADSSAELRREVLSTLGALGQTLKTELDNFRVADAQAAKNLHDVIERQHEAVVQRLSGWAQETRQGNDAAREAMQVRLGELDERGRQNSEKLVGTVQDRLDALSAANTANLEKIRETVDEKLNATLQTRLTESFGQVTTHLGEVHKGLGEMKELATGVGDLKKVLSNVSRRGNVGEFLVEQQLRHMFSAEQYSRQVQIKPNSAERVDFALKFPTSEPGEFILLPIDSKFPTSDWERLEHEYDHGTAETIAKAGTAFERSIRDEAKKICEKYIDVPTTMPHAVMVLSTEGLYAEVVRRPGLQSDIQSRCNVTIAGPSTFMAILTSFQLGFRSLKLEKKGHEIQRVLERAKYDFDKFGGLMDKVYKQVNTVQNTLGEIRGKTTTINQDLKSVGSLGPGDEAALALEQGPPGLRLVAEAVEAE